MVYFKSDKSLPAIEKLSQIMQFTTYESQKERIKLSGEVSYILAYIELEQLRHEESAFTDLRIDTSLNEQVEIPPYILSPLVENALKHGVVSNAEPILVELKADKQQLTFRVENKIGTQKKDKLGGIGLDNLQKRLEIYYPDNHSLRITSENDRFTVELTIAFK
ncbi:Sensor histidine kinase YehU [compost metagenome]